MFGKIIMEPDQVKLCYKYLKLHMKLQRIINNIKFNKKYVNLEIVPNYAVVRNKNTNPTAMKTIIYAQKYRIRQEIREAYKNKNKINLEIYSTHLEILQILGYVIHEKIKEIIFHKIYKLNHKIKGKHNKKLHNLIYAKKEDKRTVNTYNKIRNNIIYDNNKIKNLTDINFNNTEKEIITHIFYQFLPLTQ